MLMISLRIFGLLCLLLVAYLITIPVNAETEYDHPPIEIGIIADNAPYSSVESIGLRGFTIDLLDELSRLSGVQFIYRVGSWSEIYGAFLRRDIDAISEISWQEDRAKSMLFTRPFHLGQTYVFHNGNNPIQEINSLEDLDGLKVGTMTDIYFANLLKESGLEVHEYGLQTDLVRALGFGWVDVIIGPQASLHYLARKLGYVNIMPLSLAPLKGQETEDFRIAVHLDQARIHEALDQGLASIDALWLAALHERWLEYGGKSLQNIAFKLSPTDQELVRQQPPLRVGFISDYAPLSFEDGERIQGLAVDVIARIMDLTGLKVIPVIDTWSSLIESVQQGQIDAITNISYTEERHDFIRFTNPYHNLPIALFSQDQDISVQNLESLSDLNNVGISSEVFYEKTLREFLPTQLKSYENQNSLFIALSHGEVDVVIAALPIGNHWVRELGLSGARIVGELNLLNINGEDLRIGLRPGLEPLVPIINSALDAISPTEMRTIENRWLGAYLDFNKIKTEFTADENLFLEARNMHLRYCVNPDWMPLEGIDDQGSHQGISASLIEMLKQRSGLRFTLHVTDTMQESMTALKKGQCDLMLMVDQSVGISQGLALTTSYYTQPNIVLGRLDAPFINSLEELEQHPIGIVKESPLISHLKLTYPRMNLIEMENETDGLKALQRGELYGYFSPLAIASQKLQEYGFADVRVIGRVPKDLELSIGTTIERDILLSILQKLLSTLSSEDLQLIDSEWRTVSLEQKMDYTLLWQLLSITAIILMMILYWNRKLGVLNQKLAAANEQLSITSTTDQLTGLGNRTRFEQYYESNYRLCQRNKLAFLVAMIDADLFKRINDEYGHEVGDECLRAISKTMLQIFRRETDNVIRFGGEEFVIFFATDSALDGADRLEKLRANIEKLVLSTKDGKDVKMSVSIGYFKQIPTLELDSHHWLKMADRAVYEAKRLGRNRVIEANDTMTLSN